MITHQRNASWSRGGVIDVAEYGTALTDLTGWTGKSELRTDAGTLVADLGFAWVDAAQRTYNLFVANCTAWPTGIHQMDILLRSPDGVYIPTFAQRVRVDGGVTVAT